MFQKISFLSYHVYFLIYTALLIYVLNVTLAFMMFIDWKQRASQHLITGPLKKIQ